MLYDYYIKKSKKIVQNTQWRKIMEEERENISEQMEKIIHTDEVKDSGLTQLKYFFTSWTKYFNSIKVAPKILIFATLIFVLVIAKIPFKDAEKALTLESTSALLYQQFESSSIYAQFSDEELDQLVDMSLNAVENMYKLPIYILVNEITLFFTIAISALLYFILGKIFKSKASFSKVLGAGFGLGLIMAIEYFIGAISMYATGSFVNITSLGIFTMDATPTDIIYIVANYINIALIIKAVFCYYMGKELLELSKSKSIIFSLLTVVLPLALTVGQMLLSNSLVK